MKKKSLISQLFKLIGITIAGWLLWIVIFSGFTPEEAEATIEPFTGASMTFGFFTALIVLLISEINSTNNLKQRVEQTFNNISVTNKRADKLLDKANRVSEKYMSFEGEVVKNISDAIKPSKASSKTIKNSSAFEQRINEFPEIKSNNSVMELLNQLKESENIIANFKLEHNDFVANYNYQINSFPMFLFKKALKLKEAKFYSDDRDIISDEELGI